MEPESIELNQNSNENGSNAMILPGTKKSKLKGKDKGFNKKKEAPALSKSKQRKLKKLEEEKQNKILQVKSIKILGKYKISDGAHSLLHSSSTIGKAETLKEKRKRAVQYSKVGWEIPDEISIFKNKKEKKIDEENEPPIKFESSVNIKLRSDDKTHSQSSEIQYYKPFNDIPSSFNIGLSESAPQKGEEQSSIPILKVCDVASHVNLDFQVKEEIKEQKIEKKSNNNNNYESSTKKSSIKRPTVVRVLRPAEIEEKRRDLPIIMMEQEIMEAINENPVVILCGETGCGKTTQVPQFLYEAGYGLSERWDRRGVIGVTQPRRVAVLSTARRVSHELGLGLGREVGFQVRHDKMIGRDCSIKFMTDGILLREVQSDFLLKRYSVIILDEAHERSLNTDILIGMLSRVIKIRQNLFEEQQEKIQSGIQISRENRITQLKLILMSATLRVEDFTSNRKLFEWVPPVIEVPMRQFPVTIHFSKRTREDYLTQTYRKVISIHKRLPPGGVLIFVTGQREVESLCEKLRRFSRRFSERREGKDGADVALDDADMDNMEEISEAYDLQSDDRFNSQEEGDNFPETISDSSEIESDSGMETETESETDTEDEENPSTNNTVLDFLRDEETLTFLKSSFDTVAGKKPNKENPIAPPSTTQNKLSEKPEKSSYSGGLHVLPLYAMLPASAQLCVFQCVPESKRLIVVATNVAETSLTIPGIKYVIDTGREKVKNYDFALGMGSYEVKWISKASAAQRAGRAARVGPGHCYRLYSGAAYSKDEIFPEFSSPEILKIPVDGVVLLMKFMGIDKVANFPFPTPPEREALIEADNCLKSLEAIDSNGMLTLMGRAMAQYPISPRHSRMLLTSIQIIKSLKSYNCNVRSNLILAYTVAAASALSFPSPFILHFGEKLEGTEDDKMAQKKTKSLAREAYARFCNPSSDALTVAFALQQFDLSENRTEFCKSNSLHLKTMEEMSKLRKQLLQLIFHHSRSSSEEFTWRGESMEEIERSWRDKSNKNRLGIQEEEILGQAVCAGWADRIAKRVRTRLVSDASEKIRAVRYQSSALTETVYLHRSSSLSKSAPEFLVYSELLNTKRPYMHGATSVNPYWILKFASSLCMFSAPLTNPKPYYDPLTDQVYCWVSPSFGPHNWELPLHKLPIGKSTLRVSVFACALLEGEVLPCLKSVNKFLAGPPANILRPESLGQRRVNDLLTRMNKKVVDRRLVLREIWSEDSSFLYREMENWFQEKYRVHFREVWAQLQREVLLEGSELFPKRARKGRKKC